MSSLPKTNKTTVAVVTGGHAFDVPGFHTVFRSLPDADCYIQHVEDYVYDAGRVRDEYDVVLFADIVDRKQIYNPQSMPAEGGKGYEGRIQGILEQIGKNSQGIFIHHHALLAYTAWPLWSDLVGIQNRELSGAHIVPNLQVEIANPDHPITHGLEAWEMTDETYIMNEPEVDSDILLAVNHPQSMKAIGWVRTFKESRVFCLQSGHDDKTYVDPNFRKIVERGIQWCAGQI